MKNHLGKKTLSLLLAALMVLTAIPFAAVGATAAGGTLNQSGWAIISSNAQRCDESAGTFTVCSDGAETSTSIGFIDFDISGINGTVDAKLNISGKNSGNSNYNGEAFLEIFSIDPSKRPNVSGKNSSEFAGIFGSSGWGANNYTNARNAKNTIGVLNQPALAIMATKEMDNGITKAYSFDISEAVNNAKRAGQNKLCLAFLNPKSYNGGTGSWSDINVFYKNATVTYTESGAKEIAHSGATLLYIDNSTRGDASHLNVCSDGSRGNTTAAFLKFDISKMPTSVASVLLSTSVWCAQNANQNVVADIFSIDPSKCINTGGWQTTDPYDSAFGTGTPNIAQAKNYFGAVNGVAQIGIKKDGLTSTAKTVTYDVTSAVKAAKEAGKTTLCLMIINPQSYGGSASVGWSDINIAPGATKLVYSEDTGAKAYGNFNTGKYYVKLVTEIKNNYWWNNGINKAWIGFYYKPMNGTGEEVHIDMPIAAGTFASASGYKTHEYVLDGFPTRIDIDCGGISNTDNFECHPVSLSVGSSAGNYTELTGYTSEGIWKLSLQGQKTRKTVIQNIQNAQYPYAKTFDWKTSPEDTFVPKIGSNTVSAAVVAKDQYGVVMGTAYTAEVKKFAQSSNLSPIEGTGLTLNHDYKSDFSVSVAESARVANTDWFSGRITVSVADANNSQIGSSSKAFKIINQKENVTLDPNEGTLSKTNYQIYYGSALNAEINKTLNGFDYPPTATREGHTFDGFYTLASGGTKVENNAEVFHDDTYYARWSINKYTVNFYDCNGNVTSTQTVDYGKKATPPANPTKAYDSENHYTFEKWDTDFSSVKSDLEVKAIFASEAHVLVHDSSRDIKAECEKAGKEYYACSCGYSEYREGEKAPGHNWNETGRVSAGCETDGTVYFSCDKCGETKQEPLKATGHSYVETVITPAKCETAGLKKYICENCKKTDPKNGGDDGIVIPTIGHSFTEWTETKEASCENGGIEEAKCTNIGCKYYNTAYKRVTEKLGHDFSGETLTKESTCLTNGYTYKKCLRCDAENEISKLPLGEHKFSDWVEAPKASCESGGKKYHLCSVCGGKFDETDVPALGHDYAVYSNYAEATCTEPAKERAKCSRCKSYNIRNVEGSTALGHECPKDGFVSDSNATCLEDGTLSSKCVRFENCGYKETKTDVGSALGHNFKTYRNDSNATCTKNGTKTATCTRCTATDTVEIENSKLAHKVAYTSDGNATCTENGTKSGICSVCGNNITVEDEGSKIPHSFTEYALYKKADCKNDSLEIAYCDYGCEATDYRYVIGTKGEHDFPDPETESELYSSNNDATCTEGGTMTAFCKACGEAKKTVSDPNSKPAHRIAYWISDGNATCETDGTKHGSCVFGCGYKEENVRDEGSALGHWFRDYVYNNDATCTKDGTRTARCEREFLIGETDAQGKPVTARCEKTETLEANGSALSHEWSEWKLVGEKADCTNGGTRVRHCIRENCIDEATGKPFAQEEEVSALGHNYQWKITGSEKVSCTLGGEKVKVCSVCGNVDESSRTVIPASAHSYAVTEYVAPTCTAQGKRVVSCTVCGDIYSSTVIEPTDHINYSLDKSGVKKANCKDEGFSGNIVCDVCGDVVIAGTVIPKTDSHVFVDYITVKQATCLENAIEKAGCDVCANAENEREVAGSALGHTFSNYVSDGNATCTGIASMTSKCDRCDVTDTIKKYGTALGHDWGEWVTVTEATCSNKGLAERKCNREGCDVKVTKDLRKLSHKESEWIVDKEPTCTEEGHRFKKCTAGCGYIFEEETLRAKGHDFVVSESTATCLDDGYSTYTCTVCAAEKKGEIIRALGHEQGEWIITKAATCKNRGEKITKCTRCSVLIATEYIEKTAHHDSDGDGKCDDCNTEISGGSSTNCGCICHKTSWIMRVLYAVCRFFWKLFGLRSTCPCGAKHY